MEPRTPAPRDGSACSRLPGADPRRGRSPDPVARVPALGSPGWRMPPRPRHLSCRGVARKAPTRAPAARRGGPDQRRSCPAVAERGGVVDRRSTRRTAPDPRGPRARASPTVVAQSPVTWPGCSHRGDVPVSRASNHSFRGPSPNRVHVPYRADPVDRPVPLALSKNRSAAQDHEVGPARSPAHRPGLVSGMSAPGGMRRGRDAHGAARPGLLGSPRAAPSVVPPKA